MLILNKAQAYKWNGQDEECKEVINSIDWSASEERFKIAVAVLNDDFCKAAEIMKKIGVNGSLNKAAYREWPIFKEFRKSEKFIEAFEGVFEEKFDIIEENSYNQLLSEDIFDEVAAAQEE